MKWQSKILLTEENIKSIIHDHIVNRKDRYGDVNIKSIDIKVAQRLVGYFQNEHYSAQFGGIEITVEKEE